MKSFNRTFGYILWIIYSNILIYASFYYNWKQLLLPKDPLIGALISSISFASIMWLKSNKKTSCRKAKSVTNASSVLYIGLCVIAVSFLYFGKALLYEESGRWMSLDYIQYFLLLTIPVSIYVVFSKEIFHILKEDVTIKGYKAEKTRLSLRIHYTALFFMQAAILSIYFYALYPGNMSYDTYNQVSQLKGIIPFNTWHPIGHTLFIGLLLNIWNNYAIITIFQILFFAAVTSAFYVALLRYKIKWQIIYLSAIIMSIVPSVGINVVTQWKDIPFTVGILWGTLILFRMSMEKNYFSKHFHSVEFALCVLVISLFRFNGILAYIAMLIFAFAYVYRSRNKIQTRNYLASAAASLIVFFLISVIIPKQLNALPNPPGMKLRPIYQGYSAVYVSGNENDLNVESRKTIETVCTPKQMNEFYNPYFADTISSNTPRFLNNLSRISTGDAIRIYIEAAFKHPGVILGDKFNLSVTMWSVTNDRFSYNNAYTTVIQKEMTDEFGVERTENKLTDAVKLLASATLIETYLSNTLIWRTGFYLVLEFILIMYLLLERDKRIGLFIPPACNGIIVFLTMPAQDYRYLWFIFLLFPFMVLACSVDLNENNKGGAS